MMDCYIYYKSEVQHAEKIIECVAQLHMLLVDKFNHAPTLQRRPEPSKGLYTWMETYRDVEGEFESILGSALSEIGIENYINGERHLEYFLPV